MKSKKSQRVIFRLQSGENDGQETDEVLKKKLEDYKKTLIDSGFKILSEKPRQVKRLGFAMIIEIEKI